VQGFLAASSARHATALMGPIASKTYALSMARARRIWLGAQRLATAAPFGEGALATRAAVEHLGYVQIDTINVIERCHHHILFTRIPSYQRAHLQQAQSVDKTVFEYWTHALSYVPSRDIRFFMGAMQRYRPSRWFGAVTSQDVRKVVALIRKGGPLTIRDIDDDVLVEKAHPWASRKPSKRALQVAFYTGLLTISTRSGMLKSYELMDRHFGWQVRPRPASERQVVHYLLERGLRAQGIISVDSVCHQDAKRKSAVRQLIEARVRRRELVPVGLEAAGKLEHWARPADLELNAEPVEEQVHILSPFDPLVIQRKRLTLFFDYEHRFEAYLPRQKRVFGYFALPVLIGDEVVAAIDLKADRTARRLTIQQWTWVGRGSARRHKHRIEEALDRFERFQLF
jgi:uncharacterized protein YcaQ